MSTWAGLTAKEGFERLIETMNSKATKVAFDLTLEKLKAADKVLQKKLKKSYGNFFMQIARTTIGKFEGDKGRRLTQSGWGSWQRLSDDWLLRKESEIGTDEYYIGLGLGVPFQTYMEELGPEEVQSILGELLIKYTFQTPRKTSRPIYQLQTLSDLESILSPKRGEIPKRLLVTAEVMAFQSLAGVRMNEWDIVDRISQLTGDKEQWRKINATSFGRNKRPIRAIIGPAIQRYMQDISKKALEEFNNTLL